MRTFLILLCLFVLPYVTYSQYNNLKLENGLVYFEKVYPMDSINSKAIEQLLLRDIPKKKDVSEFIKTNEMISLKIKDCLIDYKKFGGKWSNTATFMNAPFYGDVSILWKDKKYKVVISNMRFNSGNSGLGNLTGSEIFTSDNGNGLNTSKIVVKSGIYLEKYLSDLFTISSIKLDW